jgi:hypothetical protein
MIHTLPPIVFSLPHLSTGTPTRSKPTQDIVLGVFHINKIRSLIAIPN